MEMLQNNTSVRLLSLPDSNYSFERKIQDSAWDHRVDLYRAWLDGSGRGSLDNTNRFRLLDTGNFEPSAVPIGVLDKRNIKEVFQKGLEVTEQYGLPEEQLILFRNHNDSPAQFIEYRDRPKDDAPLKKAIILTSKFTWTESLGIIPRIGYYVWKQKMTIG